MANELAANPDSPASLSILSGVKAALRPREQAIEQLVLAMADQLQKPSSDADAVVAAALGHWETVCQTQADQSTLEEFRKEAAHVLDRRHRQPPPLESIVESAGERSDVGYDMGIHLQGLRGTWHRLWASISMATLWEDGPEQRECIAAVRAQFEEALGRPLSADEWSKLEAHAHHHAETVMKPMLDARGGSDGLG